MDPLPTKLNLLKVKMHKHFGKCYKKGTKKTGQYFLKRLTDPYKDYKNYKRVIPACEQEPLREITPL